MSVLTQGWQDLIMTCEPFFPCDVCWGIEKETVCSMGEQWVQCWQLSTVTFPSKMINWYLIQIFRIVLPKIRLRINHKALKNRLAHYMQDRVL